MSERNKHNPNCVVLLQHCARTCASHLSVWLFALGVNPSMTLEMKGVHSKALMILQYYSSRIVDFFVKFLTYLCNMFWKLYPPKCLTPKHWIRPVSDPRCRAHRIAQLVRSFGRLRRPWSTATGDSTTASAAGMSIARAPAHQAARAAQMRRRREPRRCETASDHVRSFVTWVIC